jgi:flagellar hook assembly protein FlgD
LVVGNFPNPFNPTTTIWYSLPTSSHVTLEIYNVLGQRVTLLVDREQGAGAHTAMWDASSAPSGVYFYRLSTSDLTETRKIMLLK